MKSLLAFASLCLASGAYAQQPTPPNCGPAEQVITGLRNDHGETPAFGGIDTNGVRVILFLNAGTGSWTLVISPMPGIVCGVTEGERGQIAKASGKDS